MSHPRVRLVTLCESFSDAATSKADPGTSHWDTSHWDTYEWAQADTRTSHWDTSHWDTSHWDRAESFAFAA